VDKPSKGGNKLTDEIMTKPKTPRAIIGKLGEMAFYKEVFGLEVTKIGQVFIACLCGAKFNFKENQNKKSAKFADCPTCLDGYHFEERENSYLLIRVRTNAQIHVTKDCFYGKEMK
jgi:hypothetical protein